ncbi:hypothetical protein FTG_1326 [Francisella tularensis subsp. novicida FTG]|nr:hypothetical protein FTG_1326 [Francisella tularensis subsp. novicida FTG]
MLVSLLLTNKNIYFAHSPLNLYLVNIEIIIKLVNLLYFGAEFS